MASLSNPPLPPFGGLRTYTIEWEGDWTVCMGLQNERGAGGRQVSRRTEDDHQRERKHVNGTHTHESDDLACGLRCIACFFFVYCLSLRPHGGASNLLCSGIDRCFACLSETPTDHPTPPKTTPSTPTARQKRPVLLSLYFHPPPPISPPCQINSTRPLSAPAASPAAPARSPARGAASPAASPSPAA